MKNEIPGNQLKVDDLVRILVKSGAPISKAQAETIAAMVIARSSEDDEGDEEGKQEMSFTEYMSAIEAGTMMPFDKFLPMALKRAGQMITRVKNPAAVHPEVPTRAPQA